ncbi:hypothetical protein [Geothrix oryzisoli]|uniref:hypothetical protein n=1 Tax=Geothrix oryzisoli TaxID=2922721 RepID=UPI001FADF2EC|nr:hypothetical protein [Geothrix oryzisoli]
MASPQDPPLQIFAPKRFLLGLQAGVLVLNLFVVLMAAMSLYKSRQNREDQAVATAQNLSLVLDHYVGEIFSKADLAVLAVKEEAERVAADPAQGRHLDAFIRRQHERVPEVLAIRTTNAQGLVDHGSGVGSKANVNLSDREHFIRLRDVPETGLVVSKPLLGRLTGSWVIVLARRIERPDHSFAGMAHAVISLDQFTRAFSALDVGAHGSVALRDLDMGLIARHPEPVSAGTAVGQRIVSPGFAAFAQSGRRVGTYRALTPFDQIQRTFAIRRVSGLPFYLLVGLAERDFLADWRRDVAQEILEVLLFIGLTLAASWMVHRAWVRQQAAHARLEALLSEVKTLGGMLPICSHCKKIRDDKGYWNQIEAYLNEHTAAEFTHGICPDCAKEVFPGWSGKTPSR